MVLDDPYLVYGVISFNGVAQGSIIVYAQDDTTSSAIVNTTTNISGQYILDIQTIATDTDTIKVWTNHDSTVSSTFILDVSDVMKEVNIDYAFSGFMISQVPTSKNLYLYPTANYSICCTPVGEYPNSSCVDDLYTAPDEDTTYVYHNTASMCTDMYAMQNHTTESGIINYVRVFARAKSHLYTQSSSGVYHIICYGDGETGYSSDFNLTTDYTSYSKVWVNAPSGDAWTWDTIDSMRIGFDCSSPVVTRTGSAIFRPNEAGYAAEHSSVYPGSSPHWQYVDDVTPDDASTFVYDSSSIISSARDIYLIPDHTTEAGTISSMNLYVRAAKVGSDATIAVLPIIKIGGVIYEPPAYSPYYVTTAFKNYLYTWVNDPGGGAWTWTDIDGLQIGMKTVHVDAKTGYSMITQVYAIVDYVLSINPEIRTTSCYAVVNYTPVSSVCYLNHPKRYTVCNNRKVCTVQPERGSRVVYDLCRDNKTLTMEGVEYDTASLTAVDRLKCVRDQKDNGQYITISGMGDTTVNTTWLITDFTYERDESNPSLWHWRLSGEKYENV